MIIDATILIELFAVGLLVSAVLALFLDEVIYSVTALAGTFLFIALIYALSGALFAGIFQFAVGVGTLAILFLSGEMLGDKPKKKTPPLRIAALFVGGVMLSLPALFLSVSGVSSAESNLDFGQALWDLRGIDVVLQALVILTVALGIAIVLYEWRRK
ncbi:MAG: NADH-quinone oxidoreductase subunit J [Candidatus Bathyarchaeota archaeon]|nr:NADH-quinone oxidoreductase subunit J [Candidatus Bathyarchaeota archaeon]